MKIVIPLKDTPSAYPELKYCLRSINKFYPTDVFIVSKMKVKGTNNIYYEDKTRNRYENVRQKVLKACNVIKEPFILMNDDMYFLQKPDFPDWYDGSIEKRIGGNNSYMKMLRNTMKLSQDGLNYSVHMPMIIVPELFKKVSVPGLPFRNIYGSYSKREKREIKDPKMKTRKDHAHPDKFIKGLPLFSTSEFSLKMIYDFMDNLFPVSDGLNK